MGTESEKAEKQGDHPLGSVYVLFFFFKGHILFFYSHTNWEKQEATHVTNPTLRRKFGLSCVSEVKDPWWEPEFSEWLMAKDQERPLALLQC